jgi:hypothetical protein
MSIGDLALAQIDLGDILLREHNALLRMSLRLKHAITPRVPLLQL